jgi:hypothetical protein
VKTTAYALWAALAIATVVAAGAAPVPRPAGDNRFDAFGAEYKKPQVLPETFFNPFKVQAEAGGAKKEGAGVAADTVVEAVALRRVTGIVYAAKGDASWAIIGDQVFSIGDEVSFPDAGMPGLTPLVPGNTVVLREVDAHHLGFDVGADGEPPRRVSFSLRDFSAP